MRGERERERKEIFFMIMATLVPRGGFMGQFRSATCCGNSFNVWLCRRYIAVAAAASSLRGDMIKAGGLM